MPLNLLFVDHSRRSIDHFLQTNLVNSRTSLDLQGVGNLDQRGRRHLGTDSPPPVRPDVVVGYNEQLAPVCQVVHPVKQVFGYERPDHQVIRSCIEGLVDHNIL